MQKRRVQVSKFLSLVLRHRPDKIGLTLDEAGWVPTAELLQACNRQGFTLSLAELQAVVANNDKARFSLSSDGALIRANQGHSIPVNLGYEPAEPPEYLFHGTAVRFLPAIQEQGLVKGHRHHVHLSPDVAVARQVGQRRGREVVLRVRSGAMHRDGHVFYLSENGVWLVDAVPSQYLAVVPD